MFRTCLKLLASKVCSVAVFAAATLAATTPGFAKHVCTDAELTAKIQPYVDKVNANLDAGVCQGARDGVMLFEKSIELLNDCKETPQIQSARQAYENSLSEARQQEAGSCSQ